MNEQKLCKEDLEFRKELKVWRILYGIMAALGLFTAFLPAIAYSLPWKIDYRNISFFSGMGCSLAGSGGVLLYKTWDIMNDPEKLRKHRIASKDERRVEIERRARGIASYALLLVMYLGGVIGGIFYPVLHTCLAVLALVFLLTFLISYGILNKRM